MKMCWKCTHPQAIQDVDEFVSSSEQIWRNVAFPHLLISGSSAVNGCRQNQSTNSWWKHHINPQVILTTPFHQLMRWCKRLRFVINKCIIKTSKNPLLQYHNEKSCLNRERSMHRSSSVYMDWVVWIIVMFYKLFWTLILTAPIHCWRSSGEQMM